MPDIAPASGLLPATPWPRLVSLPRYDSDGNPMGALLVNPLHVAAAEPCRIRTSDGAPMTTLTFGSGITRFVRGAVGDVGALLQGRNA